ncbi:MAG: hypothetical protein EG828_00655 [Deltaproteobacteria bacterium]|nr:hypothetical protein [Deltaproteobacteria bacterium]
MPEPVTEMGEICNQTKSELRLLPFMLGKLVGGGMTVIGVAGLVIIGTRKPESLISELLLCIAAAISGSIVFLLCSRMMARRQRTAASPAISSRAVMRMDVIAWSLLLLLVSIALLITFIVTR